MPALIRLIKRIWIAAPVATVVLAIAFSTAVFFTVRTATHWIYWNDPAHQDQAVAGWMTPGYVSHSWDVPRWVVTEAIDLEQRPDGPRNLERLANEKGETLPELIDDIEAAIEAFRAGSLQPPSDPEQ